MGAKRKQRKLDTDELSQQDHNDDNSVMSKQKEQDTSEIQAEKSSASIEASSSKEGPQARPSSWMAGGSWRSKASPVAQIAHENISVAKGATSEALEEALKRPSQSLSKGMRGSRKSIPLAAEATRVHATSDVERDKSRPAFPSEEKLKDVESGTSEEPKLVVEDAPLPPESSEPVVDDGDGVSIRSSTKPQPAWFGWWSRPEGYGSDGEKLSHDMNRRKREVENASGTPLPGTPILEASNSPKDPFDKSASKAPNTTAPENQSGATAAQWQGIQLHTTNNTTPSRSWFNIWSSTQNEQAHNNAAHAAESSPQPVTEEVAPAEAPSTADTLKVGESPKTGSKAKSMEEQPKSSGWAFWSSDRPEREQKGELDRQVGELAVADTPSQSHPEAAQFNEQRDGPQKVSPKDRKGASSALKRAREDTLNEIGAEPPPMQQDMTPQIDLPPSSPKETLIREEPAVPAPVQRGKKPQVRPNLILPAFDDTYQIEPKPGYLERLTQYLAQSLRLPGTQLPLLPVHIHKTLSIPKVRRAIAIGVHGFFPAPLIQKVLGPPTGTSIRFANYAAASIKAWCEEHQPGLKDIEIEKVALEGEGYITDRVSTLWKLLLNWLSHLRQADFIFVACHSQGVPVATMLVAKLIQLGCLSPHVKIGICAMAGINLGPFQEYRSRLFGGTALELFEFADPNSKVSKSHAESLDICLRHGVRMTFIGSMDDQLVPLESSLFAPLSHPYVCRAIFIDGRLHTPNFLTHLLVFAVKLRNLGINDHGLIRELSGPLAGSLVGGDGHSRVYDDPAVYNLALDFALESTDIAIPTSTTTPTTATDKLLANDKVRARDKAAARRASLSGYPSTPAVANRVRRGSVSASTSLPGIAPVIAHHEPLPPSSTSANPFYLPWAVRGMLEEDIVKRDATMWAEVEQLVQEFEEWRPTSKVLKDVRWRLEGVRSML
nr:uncharacterized protein CFP56_02970 [Quercus suber]